LISQFEDVVAILKASSTSLVELAKMSKRDIFRFYNGCDLSGLDLTGQQLFGLNFDKADIRFSNLANAEYDPGAFNKSKIDSSQKWMVDEYEFSADDVISFLRDELLMFVKIRPGFIDYILPVSRMNYAQFSKAAGISTNALRKARNGEVVAIDTAQAIFFKFKQIFANLDDPADRATSKNIDHPCCMLVIGGQNGEFERVSPSRVERLLEIRRYRLTQRGGHRASDFRDTALYLSYFEEEYSLWEAGQLSGDAEEF